jgi:hypothetical protein
MHRCEQFGWQESVFETPLHQTAHTDACNIYRTAYKNVSLRMNPRNSKHVEDKRNLKLSNNLENYVFPLFMLYNYIIMHGAQNIKSDARL